MARNRYQRTRFSTVIDGESKTKQSFKDECDINNILKKYNKTGLLPDMIKQNPVYGDFSDVPDYQTALQRVQLAHEQFSGLSSRVRERFGNDPAAFLRFANDPRNGEEMVALGLATKRPVKDNVAENNDAPKKSSDKKSAKKEDAE